MVEKLQPDFLPADDLHITTPVIDMGPGTRVSNKGVRVEPRMDGGELRDFAREDEDALVALEQIEKASRGQLSR